VTLQGPAGAALQVESGLEGLYGWMDGGMEREEGKRERRSVGVIDA